MASERRPSPEEMLERARAEESERRIGRLRIFFGMAPGVGKTYAMLEAARARRAEGLDVVIGWVDTHGRRDTEAIAEGLERLPARVVEYRGLRLNEFDLEAALRRRPDLILVDELAHTNAAGSRHARRWQDVQDLIEAGVAVYTTLNVQHVESLNDVVSQITGIAVRETVPDSVLDGADEVELIDLTPEDLLQRLREGKVYIPAQAERAVERFFQKGNLIALREMALRRTAERVDAEGTSWKKQRGIEQPWATMERILVAVGPAPQSADLVRAACRMARRLRAPWIALSAETADLVRLPDEDRARLSAHLTLAVRLGAESVVVAGDDVAAAILSVARQRNVTRVVVGRPGRRRWWAWWRTSLSTRVVRESGTIDVLVTSGEEEEAPHRARPGPGAAVPFQEYAWALAAVLAGTLLSWLGRPWLALADQAMIYLVGVLVVAGRFSRGPAMLASIASVAALDFFFVPPFFTFHVSDARHIITFAVMLLTGVLVSTLTLRIRRQAAEAREQGQRTAVLYMMTRSLAFRSGVEDIAEAVARHVEILFSTEAVVLMPDGSGTLTHRGGTSGGLVRDDREIAVARWVFEHGRPAGHGTDTLPEAAGLYLPLSGTRSPIGVLGIALAGRAPLAPSQRQFLDVFANQAELALERGLLTREAESSRIAAETEKLRNALLSSVSHDFRTPLTAVTGAATSLLQEGDRLRPESRRELLETIRDEADRLGRVIGDLLDITRIESGAPSLRKEWCPLEEIIDSALGRLEPVLAGRPVRVSLPPGAILQVPVDPIIVEQLFVNLLENAAKYTPAGSPIEIRAREEEGSALVEVRDRGPGIPPGEEERIFERFYRAAGGDSTGGTGLGLAVCQAVVRAHGGRIWASNAAGGGAVFSFTLPLEGTPPAPRGVEEPSREVPS